MSSDSSIFINIFKALSDPTRLEILKILDNNSRSVNEIVDFFSLSQSTISRHLTTLASAGLLISQKSDQQKYYSVNQNGLKSFVKKFFGEFSELKELKGLK